MTVSGAIIEWLKGFESADYWKINQINTDIQGPRVNSYSLVKEPIKNVKNYVSGRKVYTEHYMFQARLASNEDIERVENIGFGEAMEQWVEDMNRDGNYPQIPDAKVKDIGITTPFYMGRTQTNDSVYQMTIAIMYEKEK